MSHDRGPRIGLVVAGLLLVAAAALSWRSSRPPVRPPDPAPPSQSPTAGPAPAVPSPPAPPPTAAMDPEIRLSVSPPAVAPGGRVEVTFSGIARPSQTDWISLYGVEDADRSYGSWEYLKGRREGRITLTASRLPGAYEARLFRDWPAGGYDRVARSARFEVQAPPVEAEGRPGLTLDRTTFEPGEPIRVRFTAPRYPNDAWIGVIPSEIAHGSEPVNDGHDVSYQYLSGRTSGEMTFTAPAKGRWDLRLHTTDAGGVETASVSFVVGATPYDLTGTWSAEDGSRCRIRQVEGQHFWLCDERKGSEGPIVAHGDALGRTVTLRLARIPRAPAPRSEGEPLLERDPLVGGTVTLTVESADALRATSVVPLGFAAAWRRTAATRSK